MNFILSTLIGVKWSKTTHSGLHDFMQCMITNIILHVFLYLVCKFWWRIWSPTPTMSKECTSWDIIAICLIGVGALEHEGMITWDFGVFLALATLRPSLFTNSESLWPTLICTFCGGIAVYVNNAYMSFNNTKEQCMDNAFLHYGYFFQFIWKMCCLLLSMWLRKLYVQ